MLLRKLSLGRGDMSAWIHAFTWAQASPSSSNHLSPRFLLPIFQRATTWMNFWKLRSFTHPFLPWTQPVSSCTSSSTQTPYHSPRTQEAGPRPTPLSPLVLRTGACYLILEAQILALCIPFPLTEGFFCPSGVLVDATCLSFRALSAGHLFREGFLGSCPHSHTNNLVSDNPALLWSTHH